MCIRDSLSRAEFESRRDAAHTRKEDDQSDYGQGQTNGQPVSPASPRTQAGTGGQEHRSEDDVDEAGYKDCPGTEDEASLAITVRDLRHVLMIDALRRGLEPGTQPPIARCGDESTEGPDRGQRSPVCFDGLRLRTPGSAVGGQRACRPVMTRQAPS